MDDNASLAKTLQEVKEITDHIAAKDPESRIKFEIDFQEGERFVPF